MKILIAYATRRGGVDGLADLLADDLRFLSHEVVVMPAKAVTDISPYGAVIVGAAVYDGAWHRDANDFVDKFEDELTRRPVWLFSARPLTDDNQDELLSPIVEMHQAALQVHAVSEKSFDARFHDPHALYQGSLPYGRRAGDWRDAAAVDRWAHDIAHELYIKLFREIGLEHFV
jgi:menaquinone-dependent protoporphyrinogen oxidase